MQLPTTIEQSGQCVLTTAHLAEAYSTDTDLTKTNLHCEINSMNYKKILKEAVKFQGKDEAYIHIEMREKIRKS